MLFRSAKEFYKKCIEYNPQFLQAYINFANLLLESGEEQEALRKARSAYLMQKNSAETAFAYGAILLKTGDFEGALKKFNKTLSINPSFVYAHFALAETYLGLGRLSDSVFELESSMEQFGELPDFVSLQNRILERFLEPNVASYEVKNALLYCNKFLERYNNIQVEDIKNKLADLITS